MKITLFQGVLLLIMFSFSFCKPSAKITNAPKPVESYIPFKDTIKTSTVIVPVSIPIDELSRSLNTLLSSKALYEDYSYTDNGGDGLMLNAWLSEQITLFVSGNTLKYRIPIKLWMKKSLYVGEAEATGTLALGFKTIFSINPDWSIQTQTFVEYHDWLEKPVLKTGIGNVGVETIANLALNRSKQTLAQSIDRIVSQQLNLRPYVQEMWNSIQTPTLLSEEYKMWVKTTPTAISMSPLTSDGTNIKAKIALDCLNDVTLGAQPMFRENASLPNLGVLTNPLEDYTLNFATDVPFGEAERIAKSMMTGQVFESGKKKVKVEDIQIWGNNDKLVVNTRLSGDFVGNIYFIGRPTFNREKNQIEIADLDFHIDTKSMLYRSASWIFQGPIKKQLAQAMKFPLDENLSALKASVQETLKYYEISPGVILTGTLDEIKVEDTHLSPTGIRVDLFSKGRVNVDVKGL